MRKLIIFGLFATLYISLMLGWDLSLGAGLSVKNVCIYLILVSLIIENIFNKNRRWAGREAIAIYERRRKSWRIHIPFILLIYCVSFSWLFVSLMELYPNYEMFRELIMLKNMLIDYYLIFLAFFYGVKSTEDALWVAKNILWLVVLSNVITLIDVFNIPDLGIIHQRVDGRVSGPLGEANQYAAVMAFFLPPLAAAIWVAVGPKRMAYVLGGVISLGCFMAASSRGAFIALVGGSLLAAFYLRQFYQPKQAIKIAYTIAGLAAIALAMVSFQFSDLLYERYEKTVLPLRLLYESLTGAAVESEDLQSATAQRSWIWMTALSLMMQEPLTFITGYGWRTFKFMSPFATHNTYLDYLFSVGIIGLSLFLILMGNIVTLIKKAINVSDKFIRPWLMGYLFGLLSLLIAIFFVELFKPWLFFWAYTGVLLRVAVEALVKSAVDGAPESVMRSNQPQLPVLTESPRKMKKAYHRT